MDPSQHKQASRHLVARLRALRAGRLMLLNASGLGLTLTWLGAAGISLLLGEWAFYLSPPVKIVGLCFWIGGTGILLWQNCLWPLLSAESLEITAKRVETQLGESHRRLTTGLQLSGRLGSTETHSEALARAAVVEAGQLLHHRSIRPLTDPSRAIRRAVVGVTVTAAALLALLQWPDSLQASAARLSHPGTTFHPPPEVWIAVTPGDTTVIAGSTLEISADLTGAVPTRATLLVRDRDMVTWSPSDLPVRYDQAIHRFAGLRRSLDYRLRAGRAETPSYHVTVRNRPVVTRIEASYHYPAYTAMPDAHAEDTGDLLAPVGTDVRIAVKASAPLARAWLSVGDTARIECAVSGRTAAAELRILRSDHYTVGLTDTTGLDNADPVTYRIVALEDHPPSVRILQPAGDVELAGATLLPLRVEAGDDFGVARLAVRYRGPESESLESVAVGLDSSGARALTQDYLWDLAGLGLLPGDEVVYRLRAWDNNAQSGPRYAETRDYIVRLPTLGDIHRRAQQAGQDVVEEMEKLREVSDQVRERLERAARDLAQDKSLAWQERRELASSVEEQDQNTRKLDEVVERLEEALKDLERNETLAGETLQKLDEVRQLLSDLNSPELRQAAESFQDALDQANPDAVGKALDALRNQQEAFRQSLDRTIALLRRVRTQQMLDALVAASEALSEEQREFGQDLARNDLMRDASDIQNALQRDAQDLTDQLDQARDQMPPGDPVSGELSRAAERFSERRVPDRMAQVSRDLGAGRPDEAKRRSTSIQPDLDALRDRLKVARDGYVERMKSEVQADLTGLAHDLIRLSRQQEEAARQASRLPASGDSEELALEQARILSGTGKAAQRLLEASQKTFFITPALGASLGKAVQRMEQTAQQIQAGKGNRAARTGAEAMGALNTATMGVRQAMADLASASSAMGFDEMLQKMAEMARQQSALNADTQGLSGQRPSGQSPGIRQLAARQRALQDALEAFRNQAGSSRRKLLGDLENIAAEMERVARDLERPRLPPRTVARQRRILSRLLDAQRSVREQGLSRERESEAAKDLAYSGPGSLPANLGERENPLRKRLSEALRSGLPPDYHSLVRTYFEMLMQDARAATGEGTK